MVAEGRGGETVWSGLTLLGFGEMEKEGRGKGFKYASRVLIRGIGFNVAENETSRLPVPAFIRFCLAFRGVACLF